MAAMSHITLELAREPGHPHGDRGHGYHLYLPLTADGRVDGDAWHRFQHACRVRRFRPGEEEKHGRILRGPGGQWRFDYDERTDADDEHGFRLREETFLPGEYLSIREDDGKLHTFQIIAIRPE